jgi:hypothetical protein
LGTANPDTSITDLFRGLLPRARPSRGPLGDGPDAQQRPAAIKPDPPPGFEPEIEASAKAGEDLFPLPARQGRLSGPGEGERRPLDRQPLEVFPACL